MDLHLTTKGALYFKQETTPQTDPLALTLTADSLIDVYDLKTDPGGLELIVRPVLKGNISPIRALAGKKSKSVTFKVPLWCFAASVATGPRWCQLFKACSCTVVTATNVTTITPSSLQPPNTNGPATVTFYGISNLKTYEVLTGCVGNAKIVLETKAHPYVEFTFTGFYVAPGPYSALTVAGGTAEVAEELAFTANSFACEVDGTVTVDMSPPVSKVEFDLGNKVESDPSISAVSGFAKFYIPSREPMLKFDIERDTPDLTNDDNLWEDWKANGNSVSADLAFHNSLIELSVAASTIAELARGDKGGIETYDVGLAAYGNDNEWSIVVNHDTV